jgi:hypothetical protein
MCAKWLNKLFPEIFFCAEFVFVLELWRLPFYICLAQHGFLWLAWMQEQGKACSRSASAAPKVRCKPQCGSDIYDVLLIVPNMELYFLCVWLSWGWCRFTCHKPEFSLMQREILACAWWWFILRSGFRVCLVGLFRCFCFCKKSKLTKGSGFVPVFLEKLFFHSQFWKHLRVDFVGCGIF